MTPALLSRGCFFTPSPSPPPMDPPLSAECPTSQFLTNRERRVFPLNLPRRSESTEPYFDISTVQPVQYLPHPTNLFKKQAKPSHRKYESVHIEALPSLEEPKADTKLPEIRYKAFVPYATTKREYGKSEYYEDYVIGGNSYNRGAREKLYQPQMIHITPKTKLRLYTRYRQLPENEGGERMAKERVESEKRRQSVIMTAKRGSIVVVKDQNSDIEYDAPAMTYGEKLERIKRLASTTIAMLQ